MKWCNFNYKDIYKNIFAKENFLFLYKYSANVN